MPQTRTAKPAPNSLFCTDMVAASVSGAMQEGWRQSLLLRVSGSGGSAGTAPDADPPPLVLADGTRISFATAEHH